MVTNGNRYFGDKSANLPKVNFYFHLNNCHHSNSARDIYFDGKIGIGKSPLESRITQRSHGKMFAAAVPFNFLIMNLGC